MAPHKVSRKLILLFINIGVLLGMVLGYRNYNVDRYSLFAVGGVSLVVLNGVAFILRVCEPDLPRTKLKQMNKWVVWPIILLAMLVLANEMLCGKR